MLTHIRLASYGPQGQGEAAMKRQNSVIWCLLIVCMTILAFTLLTRHSLYELRIRDGNREVAAVMAYESER